jgi:hypothetical protein
LSICLNINITIVRLLGARVTLLVIVVVVVVVVVVAVLLEDEVVVVAVLGRRKDVEDELGRRKDVEDDVMSSTNNNSRTKDIVACFWKRKRSLFDMMFLFLGFFCV